MKKISFWLLLVLILLSACKTRQQSTTSLVVNETNTTTLESEKNENQVILITEKEQESEVKVQVNNDLLATDLNYESVKDMFRISDFVPENSYNGPIYKYNLVVATLSVKKNAEKLKSKLEEKGDKIFIAKKTDGLYYVVIGTYENINEAVWQSSNFLGKYLNRFTERELMRQYGIPFTDTWIAVKDKAFTIRIKQKEDLDNEVRLNTYKSSPTYNDISSMLDIQVFNDMFKKGDFMTEYHKDSLKSFNVIVANFNIREEALKTVKLLEQDGEDVFFGFSPSNNYYIVAGSYDTKEEAYNRRVVFMTKYLNNYSKETLEHKFGADFLDTWILVR